MDAPQGFQVLRQRGVQFLDEPVDLGPDVPDVDMLPDPGPPEEKEKTLQEIFDDISTSFSVGVVTAATQFGKAMQGLQPGLAIIDEAGSDLATRLAKALRISAPVSPYWYRDEPHYTTSTLPKPYQGPMLHGPRSGAAFTRKGTKNI